MGDTEVVFSALGFLVIVATILAMAGFGEQTIFELPSNPYTASGGNQTTVPGQVDSIFCSAFVLGGAIAGGGTGFFLGAGIGAIAGAAVGGAIVGGIFGCEAVRDTITFIIGLGELILNFFGFLFQMLLFQIPDVPAWLNAIIVLPPGIALGFVALKTIRGAGG